jgi:hypothetical protein
MKPRNPKDLPLSLKLYHLVLDMPFLHNDSKSPMIINDQLT